MRKHTNQFSKSIEEMELKQSSFEDYLRVVMASIGFHSLGDGKFLFHNFKFKYELEFVDESIHVIRTVPNPDGGVICQGYTVPVKSESKKFKWLKKFKKRFIQTMTKTQPNHG